MNSRHGKSPAAAAFLGCLAVALIGEPSALCAAGPDVSGKSPSAATSSDILRKLTMKTMGGTQFWGDVHFFHGWSIQKNALTEHYRLLDALDHRHATGTFEDCRAKLDTIKQEQKLSPMSGKAVLLVHGIFRSSKSFSKLRRKFERDGYHVFGFDYPSTQVEIPVAAKHLRQAIDSLQGIDEISLVVHSMGGLVVRSYLADDGDERINRMVMLGVPNLGARMADHVRRNLLYRALYGPAGQQLVSDEDGLISKLPTPGFEFGILCGVRGTANGYNPLIPGDDDGTVSVSSARLPGAADFITVKCLHSFLMQNDEAIDYTCRFLETGRFRTSGERRPIQK